MAVVGLLGLVMLTVWLFRWVFGTMVELRKITIDLSILGWALGEVPTGDPSARRSVADRRRGPGSG